MNVLVVNIFSFLIQHRVEHGSIGSIDDDMLDVTVSRDVMTKPISREVSHDEQQQQQRDMPGSDGDMPLNMIS